MHRPAAAALAVLAVAAIASAGCLSGIFVPEEPTTRAFACAFLLDEASVTWSVMAPGHAGARDGLAAKAVRGAAAALADLRGAAVLATRVMEGPEHPDDIATWLPDAHFRVNRTAVTLRVLWWPGGGEEAPLAQVVAPGIVQVNALALSRVSGDLDAIATGALLHATGHALGLVNHGIPMQQDRETSAGHEGNGTMAAPWHDGLGLGRLESALQYAPASVEDLQAAVLPGGVCR